jgi:hypothetical protein
MMNIWCHSEREWLLLFMVEIEREENGSPNLEWFSGERANTGEVKHANLRRHYFI